MEKIQFGLIEGRHQMPVEKYIFSADFFNDTTMWDFQKAFCAAQEVLADVDHIHVAATGLSIALMSVVNYAAAYHKPLTVYHYNRESGKYIPQRIRTDEDADILKDDGII